MKNYLLTERALLILLLALYIFYVGYLGQTFSEELESKKHRHLFIFQQVIAGIIILYSSFLFYKA